MQKKFKILVAVRVLVAILVGSQFSVANADQVPRAKQGVWSAHTCGDGDYTLLVGSDRVMIFNGENSGYGPVPGAAHWAVDVIIMTTQDSMRILPSLDDLKRCSSIPEGLDLTYKQEIAQFRILYSPPSFDGEQSEIVGGVSLFRLGLKDDDRLVAQRRFKSARIRINTVAEARGPLAKMIWWGDSNPQGITIEGEGEITLLDRLYFLEQGALCEDSKMRDVKRNWEVGELLSIMEGKFCIKFEGVNNLGDILVATVSVDCSSISGAESFCGITLGSPEQDAIIDDVAFDSAAQKAGLDWDQKILAIGPLP